MNSRPPRLINIGNMRGWLLERLVARHEGRLLSRFGGIQTCCWCRQVAQLGDSWHLEHWDEDILLEKLTCGVCGGTSLYRFEMSMIYVGPLKPPTPAWPTSDYYAERVAHAAAGRLELNSGGPDAP